MSSFFLDTSALVKRHVIEEGSHWVRSLTHARSGNTLYIARITLVEMTSAITRRERGGSLSPAQSRAVFGHFRRHLSQRYIIVEVTTSLLTDAMSLARKRGLRAYDSVQLAAALDVARSHDDAGLSPIVLVSADKEMNLAAVAEGLRVEDPCEHH